ncbi:MAG: Wzz/FepE/Etk N-terminal domain-containing protein [Eubacteriales bacterium]|nr:Wzz/FepE/Etk N-terminal domain-containing protein [Eubacteriales bacterium]
MEANQIQENQIDLKELLFVLLKKAWLILLVGVLLAAGAGLYTKKCITPQYQSTAMMYLLGKSTSITSIADIQLGSQLKNDYIVMIKSRPVVNEVIENLNMDISYGEMVGKISVSNPSDTRILKVTATDSDPYAARDIATEFVNVSKRKMAEIMKTDEPTVVEEGFLSETPVSPNTMKNCMMAGLLGMFLTCAVLIVMYMMNDKIKTAEDIEKHLGISTLAMIPMDGKNKKNSHRRYRK